MMNLKKLIKMKKRINSLDNEKGSVIVDIIVGIFIVGIFIYMTVSFRTYLISQHNLNAKNYEIYTSINNKIQNIYLLDWDNLVEEEYYIGSDKIYIEYIDPIVTKYNTEKIEVLFHIGTEKTIKYQLEKTIEFKKYSMRPLGLFFYNDFSKITKQIKTIVDMISEKGKASEILL